MLVSANVAPRNQRRAYGIYPAQQIRRTIHEHGIRREDEIPVLHVLRLETERAGHLHGHLLVEFAYETEAHFVGEEGFHARTCAENVVHIAVELRGGNAEVVAFLGRKIIGVETDLHRLLPASQI